MPVIIEPTILFKGLKPILTSGVIYVMNRAMSVGFRYGHPEWSNLGQGAPETGPLKGDFPRINEIPINGITMGYAPINGILDLREAVANLYNDLYRQGKKSKYTAENVCISGGGRLGISRSLAALGTINVGHFVPDYASYEFLLDMFKPFKTVTIELSEENGFKIESEELRAKIKSEKLGAILISNPCNPTSRHIRGEELKKWVEIAREEECLMIMDEFYSHYIYGETPDNPYKMVSSAAYVEDVDKDPIVISEGLTKNWRYPGFRVCWTVGPKKVIEAIGSVASSLDGGPCHPVQAAAIPLLQDTSAVIKKTAALNKLFSKKARLTVSGLESLGIKFPIFPQGSFYCWGTLDNLPEPLQDSFTFFEEGLKEKVISVPGIFFDINPGYKRPNRRYKKSVRFSFGPDSAQIERGIEALGRVIKKFS